jgi:hypothetical protein
VFRLLNSNKDLASLRRVCWSTNNWVSELAYKFDPETFGRCEFTVDGKDWTFDRLIDIGFPVSSLKILNLDENGEYRDVYGGAAFELFLKRFAPHVRKLRVQRFEGFATWKELRFFAAMKKLEELEIDWIDLTRLELDKCGWLPEIYSCFRSLRIMNVHRLTASRYDDIIDWYLRLSCPKLQVLKKPKVEIGMGNLLEECIGSRGEDCSLISLFVMQSRSKFKFIDMENVLPPSISQDPCDSPVVKLLNLCYQKSIKLLNVKAELVAYLYIDSHDCPTNDMLIRIVRSVIGYNSCVHNLGLVLLEQIRIPSLHELFLFGLCDSLMLFEGLRARAIPVWTSLKSLSIHCDSDTRSNTLPELQPKVVKILDHFLAAAKLEQLEEFTLSFARSEVDGETLTPWYNVHAVNFVKCFPNLKRLKIVGWDAKNEEFSRLWQGFGLLEELWIEDCRNLDNKGFVKNYKAKHSFLHLTSKVSHDIQYLETHKPKQLIVMEDMFLCLELKKLTLKLDNMLNITDRVFRKVFSKIRFSELKLISDRPLTSVSPTIYQYSVWNLKVFMNKENHLAFIVIPSFFVDNSERDSMHR